MHPKPSITEEAIEKLREVKDISWPELSIEDQRLDTELIREIVKETLDDRDDATRHHLESVSLSEDIDRHFYARGFSRE